MRKVLMICERVRYVGCTPYSSTSHPSCHTILLRGISKGAKVKFRSVMGVGWDGVGETGGEVMSLRV